VFGQKFLSIVSGIFFLLVSLCGLYRLLVWFPISIGGYQVSQVWSFFVFVIFAALALIAFQGARNKG